MGTGSDRADDRSERLDEAMAEYLAAQDAGEPLDPAAWLEKYPDLMPELADFLDDHRHIERIVAPDPSEADTTANGAPGADPGGGRTGPDDPAIGSSIRYIGDFELIKLLGRGGMGVVYLARQLSLSRVVALKMIRDGHLASDDDLRRFRNEAEAIACVDHPNLLKLFEVGEHEGRRYFTMPLVGGGSLADHLPRYRSDHRLAARVLADVADAVHHAHQRGILHRDLKPANVLLDEAGRPLVADFGLAKRLGDLEGGATAGILGTPAYMSPEQASGARGSATTSSDVYGLGAILYAMLTGRAPFQGQSIPEILLRVREERPESPSRLNPSVGRGLETICLKCLEKDPPRRYASAAALADDLRRWSRGEPTRAKPVNFAVRAALWCRRRPVTAVLASLLVASVASGLAWGSWQWRETSRQRDIAAQVDRYFREAFLGYNDPMKFVRSRPTIDPDSLDSAVAMIEGRFADLPEVEAGIREAVGDAYRALGCLDRAEEQLRLSLELWSKAPRPDRVALEIARREYASLLIVTGWPDMGRQLAEVAYARLSEGLGPRHRRTLLARSTVGQGYLAASHPEQAREIFQEILWDNAHSAKPDAELASVTLCDLALSSLAAGEPGKAEEFFRECAAEIDADHLPIDHQLRLHFIHLYSGFLINTNKLELADKLLDPVLVPIRWDVPSRSPEVVAIQSKLVALRYLQKRYEESRKAAIAAIRSQERMHPAGHPELLNNRHVLADLLYKNGDWAGAESQYAKLSADRTPGEADVKIRDAETCQWADALVELDKYAEAASRIEAALPEIRGRPAGDSQAGATLSRILTIRGAALIGLGEYLPATKALSEARTLRNSEFLVGNPEGDPKSDRKIGITESLLGEALAGSGNASEAEEALLDGFKALSAVKKPGDRQLMRARRRLAEFYSARKLPDKAAAFREP